MNKAKRWQKYKDNTRQVGECIEWTGTKQGRGYGLFCVGDETLAHRSVWILEHGPIPDGMQILHTCDNKACVNPAHLYLGTHQDNMNDKVARDRCAHQTGELNGRARLSNDHIVEIRGRHAAGETYAYIAMLFGVTPNHIRKICVGEKWAHI